MEAGVTFLVGIIFTPLIWNCWFVWDEIAEVMGEQSAAVTKFSPTCQVCSPTCNAYGKPFAKCGMNL